METKDYEEFIRSRITELRLKRNLSEHRMSLDLDKSGSYIRGITNGLSMPSVKELINIILYFNMTPSEFFSPLEQKGSSFDRLCEKLRNLDESELEKVSIFIDWIV